jgi:hypothetical protein
MVTDKVKFVNEVPATEKQIGCRRPFRMEADEHRRYIRLEISAPVSLKKVKDTSGQFWAQGEWHTVHGSILNISAGGTLVETDQLLEEGDIVCMAFTLQDIEQLDDVMGRVKRSEISDEICLAGIEFLTRQQMTDLLSQAELDLLGEKSCTFNEGVQRILRKYVYEENNLAKK